MQNKISYTQPQYLPSNGFSYHLALNTTQQDWYANAWTHVPWSSLYGILLKIGNIRS